jgi:hypothetical protein
MLGMLAPAAEGMDVACTSTDFGSSIYLLTHSIIHSAMQSLTLHFFIPSFCPSLLHFIRLILFYILPVHFLSSHISRVIPYIPLFLDCLFPG